MLLLFLLSLWPSLLTREVPKMLMLPLLLLLLLLEAIVFTCKHSLGTIVFPRPPCSITPGCCCYFSCYPHIYMFLFNSNNFARLLSGMPPRKSFKTTVHLPKRQPITHACLLSNYQPCSIVSLQVMRHAEHDASLQEYERRLAQLREEALAEVHPPLRT